MASKGKGRAVEYDILEQTITYRHILSNVSTFGVRHPLRVIALCDSDAFYAQCETRRLGIDPSVPLVVLQWDSLIAINYPARKKWNVSRLVKFNKSEAGTKYPGLVVQHVATYKEGEREPGYWDDVDNRTHKVSLDLYRRESTKILSVFHRVLPDAEIEKASIDEAFIDLTAPVRRILLERYPHIACVPPDAPKGTDSPLPPPSEWIDWTGLGELVPISGAVTPAPATTTDTAAPSTSEAVTSEDIDEGINSDGPEIETEEADHEDVSPPDPPPTWHDVALSIGAELMVKLRSAVFQELGYTMSAGVARNKFLAKLCASYRKPNAQSILRNAAIPAYLRPMAFQKIRFLGGKLGDALAKEYDVATVGDLLHISLDEMQRKFGDESIWVYEVLRGIDRSEVKAKAAHPQSMNASKNLPQPITRPEQGLHWLRVLAAELALRLNDARQAQGGWAGIDHDGDGGNGDAGGAVRGRGIWPKSLALHARQGYEASHSKQVPFPFSVSRTGELTVDTVAAVAEKLWKELVPNDGKTKLKINAVSLSFQGIEMAETGQRSIDMFLRAKGGGNSSNGTGMGSKRPSDEQMPTLTTPNKKKARVDIDMDLNEDDVVPFADILPQLMDPSYDEQDQQQGRRSASPVKQSAASNERLNEPRRQTAFTCPRCHKKILSPDVDGFRDAEEELNKLKMEHDDWHLAQDLAREVDGDIDRRTPIRADDRLRPTKSTLSSGSPSVQKKNKKVGSKNARGKEEASSRKKADITQFFMRKS